MINTHPLLACHLSLLLALYGLPTARSRAIKNKKQVETLARNREHQHLIIESTGISDPTPVAEGLVRSERSTDTSEYFLADDGEEGEEEEGGAGTGAGSDGVVSLGQGASRLHRLPGWGARRAKSRPRDSKVSAVHAAVRAQSCTYAAPAVVESVCILAFPSEPSRSSFSTNFGHPACTRAPGEEEAEEAEGGEDGGGGGGGMFKVDTLVTVVDSTSFLDEIRKADELEERGLEAMEGDTRTIADLLISQASKQAGRQAGRQAGGNKQASDDFWRLEDI